MKKDYNLVVIGAGSAGLVTSYIGALVNAKVALIERHKMGGDCLNTGCVPSKALIKSAKLLALAKNSEKYGIKTMTPDFNFADIMDRVHEVIAKIEPHDSVERYTGLGVECIEGEANIKSKNEVEVNGKILTTKNIVIATGARPLVPPFEGLDSIDYVTSDTIWNLRELPKRLLVLGGGPIGCELSQCFARFGSQVTLVDRSPRIMAREDAEVSQVIHDSFKHDGIQILTDHSAVKFKKENGINILVTKDSGGNEKSLEFDLCLMALGRKANTEGFGLQELGVELNDNGTVKVDPYLRTTKFKNMYACGDVAGPYQFTHTASHQAWYVAVNSLFKPFYKKKVDYSVVPWVTFTDPEVAHVGLSEEDAKKQGLDYEVTSYHIDDLDRAIADSETRGFVKVITPRNKDRILGATIVGQNAGDMLLEFTAAMRHGFGFNKIMSTIHPYPTMGEANKFSAGVWKNNHKPEGILKWLAKFHGWRR